MSEELTAERYQASPEDLATLVEEHSGWATSIAKCVARAWSVDWELDGLDGGAFEALVFCAQRFDPARGVPFKAYARRRIHEAATEEARRCKTWRSVGNVSSDSSEDGQIRAVSAKLVGIYPEISEGELQGDPELGASATPNEKLRSSLKQLLISADLLLLASENPMDDPAKATEFRHVVDVLATLDVIHQSILWELYWNGLSMRSVADHWGVDELVIIREHKQLVEFLQELFTSAKKSNVTAPKLRPSLRKVADTLIDAKLVSPVFSRDSRGLISLVFVALLALSINIFDVFIKQ